MQSWERDKHHGGGAAPPERRLRRRRRFETSGSSDEVGLERERQLKGSSALRPRSQGLASHLLSARCWGGSDLLSPIVITC